MSEVNLTRAVARYKHYATPRSVFMGNSPRAAFFRTGTFALAAYALSMGASPIITAAATIGGIGAIKHIVASRKEQPSYPIKFDVTRAAALFSTAIGGAVLFIIHPVAMWVGSIGLAGGLLTLATTSIIRFIAKHSSTKEIRAELARQGVPEKLQANLLRKVVV